MIREVSTEEVIFQLSFSRPVEGRRSQIKGKKDSLSQIEHGQTRILGLELCRRVGK